MANAKTIGIRDSNEKDKKFTTFSELHDYLSL